MLCAIRKSGLTEYAKEAASRPVPQRERCERCHASVDERKSEHRGGHRRQSYAGTSSQAVGHNTASPIRDETREHPNEGGAAIANEVDCGELGDADSKEREEHVRDEDCCAAYRGEERRQSPIAHDR